MVSRRKILSRSRDDLNLDQTFSPQEEVEEDIWYQKDKLYKEHIQEVLDKWTQIDDEIWAKVIVFERNRRVAKAYARAPVLTINGSDDGFDGMRIGLCGFDNPMRDQKTEEFKRHIGQGVKIKMDDAGNILIRRYAKSNVYIKSTASNASEETSIGADILKLPNQALESEKIVKLFDMKKFQSNVNRELRRAYPDRRRLETQCLSAVAFVKSENDILECPIWVLIVNVVAMDMLKSKLPPAQRPMVDIKNRPRIPIPDEDPYSVAGNGSGGSSGSSGFGTGGNNSGHLQSNGGGNSIIGGGGGGGSNGIGGGGNIIGNGNIHMNGNGGTGHVAATREQLLLQTQQLAHKRSEKPPKLPPRDNIYSHDLIPKPDYDDIDVDTRIKLSRGKSDKGKDNKKYDDPYYCGLRARVPNFVKSSKSAKEHKDLPLLNNGSSIINGHPNSTSNNMGTLTQKKTSMIHMSHSASHLHPNMHVPPPPHMHSHHIQQQQMMAAAAAHAVHHPAAAAAAAAHHHHHPIWQTRSFESGIGSSIYNQQPYYAPYCYHNNNKNDDYMEATSRPSNHRRLGRSRAHHTRRISRELQQTVSPHRIRRDTRSSSSNQIGSSCNCMSCYTLAPLFGAIPPQRPPRSLSQKKLLLHQRLSGGLNDVAPPLSSAGVVKWCSESDISELERSGRAGYDVYGDDYDDFACYGYSKRRTTMNNNNYSNRNNHNNRNNNISNNDDDDNFDIDFDLEHFNDIDMNYNNLHQHQLHHHQLRHQQQYNEQLRYNNKQKQDRLVANKQRQTTTNYTKTQKSHATTSGICNNNVNGSGNEIGLGFNFVPSRHRHLHRQRIDEPPLTDSYVERKGSKVRQLCSPPPPQLPSNSEHQRLRRCRSPTELNKRSKNNLNNNVGMTRLGNKSLSTESFFEEPNEEGSLYMYGGRSRISKAPSITNIYDRIRKSIDSDSNYTNSTRTRTIQETLTAGGNNKSSNIIDMKATKQPPRIPPPCWRAKRNENVANSDGIGGGNTNCNNNNTNNKNHVSNIVTSKAKVTTIPTAAALPTSTTLTITATATEERLNNIDMMKPNDNQNNKRQLTNSANSNNNHNNNNIVTTTIATNSNNDNNSTQQPQRIGRSSSRIDISDMESIYGYLKPRKPRSLSLKKIQILDY